jgi:hypothetical protein
MEESKREAQELLKARLETGHEVVVYRVDAKLMEEYLRRRRLRNMAMWTTTPACMLLGWYLWDEATRGLYTGLLCSLIIGFAMADWVRRPYEEAREKAVEIAPGDGAGE